MTGMKEGAGEDPFADDQSENPDKQTESEMRVEDKPSDEHPQNEQTPESNTIQIPYKLRRDGVQDGRTRVPLFIQNKTKRAERQALRDLEEQFDEDISLTDLREAVVKAGLRQHDEVAAQLEEWGYGMTFES